MNAARSGAATNKLPRPKRNCTVQEFHCSYLPEAFSVLTAAVSGTWPKGRFVAGFCVSTPGAPPTEECASATLEGGNLSTSATAPPDPLFSFSCDHHSFMMGTRDTLPQVLRHLNRDVPGLTEAIARYLEQHGDRLTPEVFRALPGVVEIHYTDDAGDVGVYRVAIGSGEGPRARIDATHTDLWALLRSSGQLLRLIRNQLAVSGDVGYLIRLVTAATP